jgi:hypothetical protein
MSADRFVGDFLAKLRAKCAELRAYGASDSAQACEQVAVELEADWHAWWLAGLTVGEAAAESGYSEERLREMARDGTLPHRKGDGTRGHLTISRSDLPRRPKVTGAPVSSLEQRLLHRHPTPPLRKQS